MYTGPENDQDLFYFNSQLFLHVSHKNLQIHVKYKAIKDLIDENLTKKLLLI